MKAGLAALIAPEESVLLLMDHQAFQFANLHSHEPTMVINNVFSLAKGAKAFGVPTTLNTINSGTGGAQIPGIQAVFPDQQPSDRTAINTWHDEGAVAADDANGRTRIIMVALWTEICLAMPTIQAIGEGWDVTIVSDASSGISKEAYDLAVMRMVSAGATPMTWLAVLGEWQRDSARLVTVPGFAPAIVEHAGGSGIAFGWEQQFLATHQSPSRAGETK